MINETVSAFIETKVREVNGAGDAVLLLYENQPDTHEDGEPFISVWTIFGNTLKKGVGADARRELIGFVQIDSLSPVGTGLGEAKRRGSAIADSLSQRSFRLLGGTLFFGETHETNIKPFGGYQRVMFRIGFWVSLV